MIERKILVQLLTPDPKILVSELRSHEITAGKEYELLDYHESLVELSPLAFKIFLSRLTKRYKVLSLREWLIRLKKFIGGENSYLNKLLEKSDPKPTLEPIWFAIRLKAALQRTQNSPDLIINMYTDLYSEDPEGWKRFDLRMRKPWVGITFKAGIASAPNFMKYSTSCIGLYALSPNTTSIDGVRKQQFVRILPNFTDVSLPSYQSNLVTKIKFRAESRRILVLCGSISKRKSLGAYAYAVRNSDPKTWYFVIAGKIFWHNFDLETQDNLRKLLSEFQENLYCAEGYMNSEREVNDLIRIADVIWGVYEAHKGNSDMLLKAIALKRHIIVSNGSYMADVVSRYGIGKIVDPTDYNAVLNALTTPFSANDENFNQASDLLTGGLQEVLSDLCNEETRL